MRIKEDFVLKDIMGQSVIITEGKSQIDFDKLIAFNPSAKLLWNNAVGKDFTNEDLAKVLTENYEIDYATALQDATEVTEDWKKQGLVEF